MAGVTISSNKRGNPYHVAGGQPGGGRFASRSGISADQLSRHIGIGQIKASLPPLKPVKTSWTEEEWAKEDNPNLTERERKAIRRLAESLTARAAGAEPGISPTVRAAIAFIGGKESGIDSRVKTGPSLYRKMQTEILESRELGNDLSVQESGKRMRDTVRYTAILSEKDYWKTGTELVSLLDELGVSIIKSPEGIQYGGCYRGRNVTFRLNGVEVELQIHTEASSAVAKGNHAKYEEVRALKATHKVPRDAKIQERIDQLEWEMQNEVDLNVPIEAGTPVLLWDHKTPVWFTAKQNGLYGPTLEGGFGRATNRRPELTERPPKPIWSGVQLDGSAKRKRRR